MQGFPLSDTSCAWRAFGTPLDARDPLKNLHRKSALEEEKESTELFVKQEVDFSVWRYSTSSPFSVLAGFSPFPISLL